MIINSASKRTLYGLERLSGGQCRSINAQVDFRVTGARATHDIDVYATFLRSGILCTG